MDAGPYRECHSAFRSFTLIRGFCGLMHQGVPQRVHELAVEEEGSVIPSVPARLHPREEGSGLPNRRYGCRT